ncbi:MAG: c-type cytochrome [Nitrococcus sp.]|nr:c-type cytochrome [Nitrococcus sp.]
MSQEADREFVRNFIIVLAALAVSGIVFAILGVRLADAQKGPQADAQLRSQLEADLQAVGDVSTSSEPAAASTAAATTSEGASGGPSGEEVVGRVCGACHKTGLMGAPQIGNKAQWAPRAKQGLDTLVTHALNGFGAMPPQGGTVSKEEAQAAIKYMVVEKTGLELK